MNMKNDTRRMILFALFSAIILILNFTPIGYIQLPLVKATIIHIPVIIGAILMGPRTGAGLGFIFGLTSLYNNTFTPTILSFAFSPAIPLPGTGQGSWISLIITFVPRILVGIVSYYVYQLFNRLLKEKGKVASLALGGLAGSLTNTIFVMGLIFILFRDAYGSAFDLAIDAVLKTMLTVVFANGIPEALLAAFLTAVVCRALQKTVRI